MEPNQVTLYMEIGSRAFSDLAGEASGVALALIKNRCLRAGYEPKPKRISIEAPGSLVTGRHYTVTMPLKGVSQAVLTVVCEGFTKNNNMHARITYGHKYGKYKPGKKIVVLRKDILCEAKGGWDD